MRERTGEPLSELSGISGQLGTWEETTRDWLEVFDADVAAGKDLSKSIFWRLAADVLPEGVDRSNPRVLAAQEKIRESMRKDG